MWRDIVADNKLKSNIQISKKKVFDFQMIVEVYRV